MRRIRLSIRMASAARRCTRPKGNQYYFGMKAYIGVDVESGLVHSVVGTAANVEDVTLWISSGKCRRGASVVWDIAAASCLRSQKHRNSGCFSRF